MQTWNNWGSPKWKNAIALAKNYAINRPIILRFVRSNFFKYHLIEYKRLLGISLRIVHTLDLDVTDAISDEYTKKKKNAMDAMANLMRIDQRSLPRILCRRQFFKQKLSCIFIDHKQVTSPAIDIICIHETSFLTVVPWKAFKMICCCIR